MTENQQKLLQKMYTEQRLAESNLALLQQRLEVVQAYTTNYRAGLAVLKELEGKEEGEEVLMNVGGSIFVQANLVNPGTVTRGIGSGVRIEQSVVDATKEVEDALSKLEKQSEELSEQYNKIAVISQTLSAQIQQLAEQMQQ
ncbi:MAG: prefoldin subunit alpha [Candidatus Thorarchaeota archaeon]|nr:MAG: prefoldin subunit alpha [Candidatus Thorarchaeota archaeon]